MDLIQASLHISLKELRLSNNLNRISLDIACLKIDNEINNKINELKETTDKLSLVNKLSNELKDVIKAEIDNCDKILSLYKMSNKRYIKQAVILFLIIICNIVTFSDYFIQSELFSSINFIASLLFIVNFIFISMHDYKDKKEIKKIKNDKQFDNEKVKLMREIEKFLND